MQKLAGAFVVVTFSIYAHTRSTCRTRLHKPLSVRKLLLLYYYIAIREYHCNIYHRHYNTY